MNINDTVIRKVSSFIVRSGTAKLPPEVIKKAKHHILDTLAAMISGSRLKPGRVAILFAESQMGLEEAQVIGSRIVTSAINAAFANGMMAHADETDDSHELSGNHPGCAVIPAALAISEKEGADGLRFLKGVVVGYEMAVRMNLALGGEISLKKRGRSTHSWGGNFGAAAATASILQLDEKKVRYALSYTAHRASGALHYVQDKEHIEKAFVFGGMPAQNGVSTGILMQSGFTGVLDLFSGDRNFLDIFSPETKPGELTRKIGRDYAIMSTNIKKYAVGSPIQAPLDAVILLMKKHRFTCKDVQSIMVYLPAAGPASTIDNRSLPNINLQYLLAACIFDGQLTSEATHSFERMNEPAIVQLRNRIKINVAPELLELSKTERQAVVEVFTKNGIKFREHVRNVRGSKENPMTKAEVKKKCVELILPRLGKKNTDKLIHTVWNLEKVKDMRQLRPLLSLS
jgi:2-methylcitrate dehydratase PrpD